MKLLGILLTALACSQFANGLRILGVFPIQAKSHWTMTGKLMATLAERGHRVDVISHFRQKTPIPNYTDIPIRETMKEVVNSLSMSNLTTITSQNMRALVESIGSSTCKVLGLPQVQQLIKNPPNDPPYDLVIVELFFSPCHAAFGRHLNVPMIGITTSDLFEWLRSPLGIPSNTAYMPSIFSSYDQNMTFWERVKNTLSTESTNAQIAYLTQKQMEYVKESFGFETTVDDLLKDVAAVLINSHHSLYGIKPMTQGLIEVGGLHISEESDPLSSELQKWLDQSKHGCILFTFGSMMRIETFPKALLETFYKVFAKIAPVRVLMKVMKKEDLPPGLPKNVMIQPWFPQVAVFKHKNTKAFITHGGLMSKMEAIHFGIPMVGIPLFGDQHINLKTAANKKIAVTLGSINNVTEETLSYAINAVLYDDTYRNSMKKESDLFKDRPMKPIDTAVYWVEYIAKYGNILQSPALSLNWWQRNLWDVYGFLFASIASALYIAIVVLRKLKKWVLGSKSCSKKNSRDSKKYK